MKKIFIIVELDFIIDVCSSEESAKKALEYWIKDKVHNYEDEEEARNCIIYEPYEMDQFS